ncbi:hypothetical protein NOVO_06420 [Rickettsiales bacterium Ac37b]|nr:hypothetical protein NOVO_06420 [Rickettsiales bacterium Ac37b]
MSDIFTEIDQELKQEKLIKVISKYAPYAIIAIIIILILAISKIAWSNYNVNLQEKAGDIFNTTMTLNKTDDRLVKESLNYLISLNQKNIFSTLATFNKASLEIGKDNKKEALQLYHNIYNSKNTDLTFRQLAGLLYVVNSTNLTEKEINDYFTSLNNIKGPFNDLIKLENALFLLDRDNKSAAIDILEKLKDDQKSYFVYKRAEEILTVISQN